MNSRPTVCDLGIDKLSQEDQLALAREIIESIYGGPPGMMTEEELDELCERRDREMDENPEMVLSEEEFWKRVDRRK